MFICLSPDNSASLDDSSDIYVHPVSYHSSSSIQMNNSVAGSESDDLLKVCVRG